MIMLVEFYRAGEGRLCGWIATPPHRRPFQGSTMAAGRGVVNGHYHAWKHNETTPLKPALDAMYGQWLALRDGERADVISIHEDSNRLQRTGAEYLEGDGREEWRRLKSEFIRRVQLRRRDELQRSSVDGRLHSPKEKRVVFRRLSGGSATEWVREIRRSGEVEPMPDRSLAER